MCLLRNFKKTNSNGQSDTKAIKAQESRMKSITIDQPFYHVDGFRTVLDQDLDAL